MISLPSPSDQIISDIAHHVGVGAVVIHESDQLIADDEIIVYSNGQTYVIKKDELYDPFSKSK